jgi:hypothetical protein
MGPTDRSLLPETKSNRTRIADVVISYLCASGLSPGLWLERLRQLWPHAAPADRIIRGGGNPGTAGTFVTPTYTFGYAKIKAGPLRHCRHYCLQTGGHPSHCPSSSQSMQPSNTLLIVPGTRLEPPTTTVVEAQKIQSRNQARLLNVGVEDGCLQYINTSYVIVHLRLINKYIYRHSNMQLV